MKANTTITSAAAVLALLSLTGLATAQEPPVLIGNFSANIHGAVNLTPELETQQAMENPRTFTRMFGYSWRHRDERPVGNYSAAITVEEVPGR